MKEGPSFEEPKDLKQEGVRASREEFEIARRDKAIEEASERNETIIFTPDETARLHEKARQLAEEAWKKEAETFAYRAAVEAAQEIVDGMRGQGKPESEIQKEYERAYYDLYPKYFEKKMADLRRKTAA